MLNSLIHAVPRFETDWTLALLWFVAESEFGYLNATTLLLALLVKVRDSFAIMLASAIAAIAVCVSSVSRSRRIREVHRDCVPGQAAVASTMWHGGSQSWVLGISVEREKESRLCHNWDTRLSWLAAHSDLLSVRFASVLVMLVLLGLSVTGTRRFREE